MDGTVRIIVYITGNALGLTVSCVLAHWVRRPSVYVYLPGNVFIMSDASQW